MTKDQIKSPLGISPLAGNVLEVRSLEALKKVFGWSLDPTLEDRYIYENKSVEDLNDRRIRDAEVLGAACCNGNNKIILEIGTSLGYSTALMAKNSPQAKVYTVNIPPEEINKGGNFVTHAPDIQEIGRYYREQGCSNVVQILENTLTWEPSLGTIDLAFIDGCHDSDFVYQDTCKILAHCRSGSLILWHDFCPQLMPVYPWIADVGRGVGRLIQEHRIHGKIFHLQDSWIGLYRVP